MFPLDRRCLFLMLLCACATPKERADVRDASEVGDEPANDASANLDARADATPSSGDARVESTMADASRDAAAGEPRDAEGTMNRQDAQSANDAAATGPGETFVYVGGADWSNSPYPYRAYRLERATGRLSAIQEAVDLGENPSYAVATRDGRFLYVANEKSDSAGVTAASIDVASGRVTRLGYQPLPEGGGVVFTALDPNEKFVLAADYDKGRAAVYRIESDGRLSAPVDVEVFASGAHSHSIRAHPTGKWAYVSNKDANEVAQFAFDATSGKLTALTPAKIAVAGGPRHIALTPDGRYAFVMLEGDDKINAYAVGANGALSEVDSQSSLPASFSGTNTGAHVLVHPNGKFVYGSNRGHDSIVVFALDDRGKLTLLQHVPTMGNTPRNFDIDVAGELMVVANQGDGANGSLVVFAIGSDGKLTRRGDVVTGLRSPQSVTIVTRPK